MERLFYTRTESPVGPLVLGASEQSLVVLEFVCGTGAPQAFSGRVEWIRDDQHSVLTATIRELNEYFAGKRREFTIRLDLRGPEFHRRCWQALLEIPYGETCSYGELAKNVGSPGASRAVGQANHHNPIAIIVPCHRVITSTRELGGYGGGLSTKEFLLKLEGARFRGKRVEQQQLSFVH
ncbi:MAG TPA: methylated-DNA--[protein]-cysteine S-methyltransferase [Candidatus Acidoferrales bacterium]|nr:methylated-DNA--[protein]-cysteine S-methyltransferase [Candidatus Acidoferrales bacterium]